MTNNKEPATKESEPRREATAHDRQHLDGLHDGPHPEEREVVEEAARPFLLHGGELRREPRVQLLH